MKSEKRKAGNSSATFEQELLKWLKEGGGGGRGIGDGQRRSILVREFRR